MILSTYENLNKQKTNLIHIDSPYFTAPEGARYTREDLVQLEAELRKLNSSIVQNEYICSTR